MWCKIILSVRVCINNLREADCSGAHLSLPHCGRHDVAAMTTLDLSRILNEMMPGARD